MKNQIKQKILLILWGCIATYFMLVSLAGLFVARNFDPANGYRKETIESLLVSLAFGATAAIACFGLHQRKTWSRGIIFGLSGVSILYAASFFAKNPIQTSGSAFILLLLVVSGFSIVAIWRKADNAQPRP